jgi:hypothetical protein
MTTNKLAELAQRKAKLANDYKVAVAALRDEAKEANIDPAALGRLVTYMRKDEQARLDQQAVDDQYRFLAGLRSAAAEIPPGGQLAMAAALYAKDMKVRAVADKMGISVGKAHKLKVEAAAFNVQPRVNMNVAQKNGDNGSVPAAAHGAAPRQPKTAKQQPVEDDSSGNSVVPATPT